MNRLLFSVALAAVAVAAVCHTAQAAIVLTEGGVADPSAGIVSAYGAPTITFDGGTGPLTANIGSVLYTSGTTPYVAAAPYGDNTGYASVGSTTTPQTATLSLGGGVNYLGFYWGSVDSYNTLTLHESDGTTVSFNGSDILNPANGYQGATGSAFVNFFTFGADKITSVDFSSSQKAFEVDSITAGVPEPATWALMTLGFLGLGFLGFRRRTGASFRVA